MKNDTENENESEKIFNSLYTYLKVCFLIKNEIK